MAKMTVGKFVWGDKRTYRSRLLIAAAVSFALCFTVLFFGPFEIAVFNGESLVFGLSEVVKSMLPMALIVFAALALALPLLRGRIFDAAVGFLFGLLVAAYLQANVFGNALGALTGDGFVWNRMAKKMLLNLLVWALIIAVPFIVHMINREIWRKVLIFGSLLLIVMQGAALAVMPFSTSWPKGENKKYYLSMANFTEYSKRSNTVVFLLDRLDYDYIKEVINDKPDFFERLDGFTSYTNAISSYARTRPGGNSILTGGGEGAYIKEAEDYFVDSWNQGDRHILDDLAAGGYTVDIYDLMEDMFGRGEPFDGKVDNLTDSSRIFKRGKIRDGMLQLSLYRYTPVVMKPFFWCYTDDINNGVMKSVENSQLMYEIDETIFDSEISSFTTNDDRKYLKFYHFMGSHTPYTLDENGHKSDKDTNVVAQTEGCFNILYRAFDKMKEMGIYKDTAILILADHGTPIDDARPVLKATCIGMFYKPAGAEGTPLAVNNAPVSLENIPATILKSCGLGYEAYGSAIDEIAQDADVVRKFYKSVLTKENLYHETYVHEYDIVGDAKDFDNWKEVRVYDVVHPFF